ncbi:hypothetical protein BJ742DRAFT_825495 [Cladochytrium replicatum]|nr:hypothetical protein BJ742DRAFT_825495 [Cladochytrium replicatum]
MASKNGLSSRSRTPLNHLHLGESTNMPPEQDTSGLRGYSTDSGYYDFNQSSSGSPLQSHVQPNWTLYGSQGPPTDASNGRQQNPFEHLNNFQFQFQLLSLGSLPILMRKFTELKAGSFDMSKLVTSSFLEPYVLLWWRLIAAGWLWFASLIYFAVSHSVWAVMGDSATIAIMSTAFYFTLSGIHMYPFLRSGKVQQTTDRLRLFFLITYLIPVAFTTVVSLTYWVRFVHYYHTHRVTNQEVAGLSFRAPHGNLEWITVMNVMVIAPVFLMLEGLFSRVPLMPTHWHLPAMFGTAYLIFLEIAVIPFGALKPNAVQPFWVLPYTPNHSRILQGSVFILLLIVLYLVASGIHAVRDSILKVREVRMGGAIIGGARSSSVPVQSKTAPPKSMQASDPIASNSSAWAWDGGNSGYAADPARMRKGIPPQSWNATTRSDQMSQNAWPEWDYGSQ